MYRVVPFLKLGIVAAAVIIVVTLAVAPAAFAHGVASADQIFIAQTTGAQVIPFIYLGAKHMVTGYDICFSWSESSSFCTKCETSGTTSPCSRLGTA